MTTADIPAQRPLQGVRVIDASRYLPGPFCALQLSWLGAQVTSIEQPPHGDPMRAVPPHDVEGTSLAYRSLRRDVDVQLLDLSTDAGREQALELVDGADVFVESFRPGVAERLGIGPRELRARNERLIYCSLSGYGQTGPWAQAAGHDINYEAASGLLEQTGTRVDVVLPPVPMADLAGGLTAATAICAALVRRSVTGEGCTLDISLTEAALALQAMQLPGADEPTGAGRGEGFLTGGFASYRPYRCRDGRWVAIGPVEPKFFAALCAAVERPDLLERQYDPAAQGALQLELKTLFAGREAAEWETLLAGEDGGASCVCRVLHPAEVREHPQVKARGAVMPVPGSPERWMPASPYVVDGIRSDVDAAAAASGQL